MRFATTVFRAAGIIGMILLLPLYFLESQVGREVAVTHPEFYYGFLSTALAWQMAFLAIARDPVKLRWVMPAAMMEKFLYVASLLILAGLGKSPGSVLIFAAVDGIWGILFVVAWLKVE